MTTYLCQNKDLEVKYKIDLVSNDKNNEYFLVESPLQAAKLFQQHYIRNCEFEKLLVSTLSENDKIISTNYFILCCNNIIEITSYTGIRYF